MTDEEMRQALEVQSTLVMTPVEIAAWCQKHPWRTYMPAFEMLVSEIAKEAV